MASGSQAEATFNSVNSSINAGRDVHLYTVAGALTVHGPDSESSVLARLKTMLNPISSATYDSYEASRRSECFPNTRVQLLNDIEAWLIGESNQAPIYILDGVAGIGKSTVAQTIAIRAANLGLLGASFFFSRDEDLRKIARHFFPTIAYQLSHYNDTFATRISQALDRDPDAPEKVLHQQLSLLLMPLQDLLSQRESPTLIIVDALDECEEEGAEALLTLLGQYVPRISGLKIFITTRPEWHVRRILDEDRNHERFRIHEIEESIVQSDIRLYLQSRLSIEELRKVSRNRRNPWQPNVNDMDTLCGICGTLFIIAATAIKFILDPKRLNPQKQLSRLLDGVSTNSFSGSKINVLDDTYIRIIFAAQSDLDEIDDDWFRDLNKVLGALITLANPLPCQILASLLEMDPDDIEAILSQLHSLVAPSGSGPDMTFRVHHKSFPDFITDRERIQRALTSCKLMTRPDLDSMLWIDVNDHHLQLAKACFRIMNRDLRWNMAGISEADWYKDMDDIPHVTPQLIPQGLAYAALHWAYHLLLSHKPDADRELQEYLEAWSSRNILAWIEVMVMIKRVCSIYKILKDALDSLSHVTSTPWTNRKRVQDLLSDTWKFVQRGSEVMQLSPMHIYRSCLPMVPTETALYRAYGNLVLLKIIRVGSVDQWDALVTALTGHSEVVTSVAFSTDGSRLASGSTDTTVRLWDITTSAHVDTLTGHEGSVESVAFSPDGSVLASGSNDQTIRLWNAKTGLLIFILPFDAEVRSVSFSRDSSRLVSAGRSEDGGIIQLWDVKSGANIISLTGHSACVSSVAFSMDGSYLASASYDTTIRIWDANSYRCISTLECISTLDGHSSRVASIAFSTDGIHMASGCHDLLIYLWDFKAGTVISTLVGHVGPVYSVSFSNDGLLLASGSESVRLWDAEAGILISTFTSHSSEVFSVAFSTDSLLLASGSEDGTVRLWNPEPTTLSHSVSDVTSPNRHLDRVSSVVFSSDGSKLVSGSYDCTIRLWDAELGALIHTFNNLELVWTVALSSDGSRLFSGSFDDRVRIWDTKTGVHIHTIISDLEEAATITFSSDCSTLAISDDLTIQLWDLNRGVHTLSLTGHSGRINSAAFSNDGSRLVSGSQDDTIRIWDITTGLCQSSISMTSILGEHSTLVDTVVFSDDGSQLAFTCFDKSVHIWDANTGSHISTPLIALSDSDSTKVMVQKVAFLPGSSQIVGKVTHIKPQSAFNHSTPDSLHLLLLVQREAPVITGLVVATLHSHEWEFALLCWFPHDATVASFGVHSSNSKVAIGCSDGQIMLLDFSQDITYHSSNSSPS